MDDTKPPGTEGCLKMDQDSVDDASSPSLTEKEANLLKELRVLGTMIRKSIHVERMSRTDVFESLLRKVPSLCWETPYSKELPLLHYLAAGNRSHFHHIVDWGSMLMKVWRVYPPALDNDPSILTNLIGGAAAQKKNIEGDLLDFAGMVGERYPHVYPTLKNEMPTIACHWKRLLHDESDDPGKPLIFEAYPHLMRYATSMSVSLDGLEERERERKKERLSEDAIDDMSALSEGDADSQVSEQQPLSPKARGLRQVVNYLLKYKDVSSLRLCVHVSDLEVTFRIKEKISYRKKPEEPGCFLNISNENDLAEGILPIFRKNRLPISKLECIVRRPGADENIVRLRRLLAGCHIIDWSLGMWEWPRGHSVLNDVFRMVVQHQTIRKLEINVKFEQNGGWGDVSALAGLVNLEELKLKLRKVGRHLVPPLTELLRRSQKLQYLDLRGTEIPNPDQMLVGVGQSRTVKEFGCEVDHSPHLYAVLHSLETTNTTLTKVQMWWGHLGPPHDLTTTWFSLRSRIEFFCDLNRIGRGRIREGNLTKRDFVMNVIGVFARNDRMLNELFVGHGHDHARVLSLLYSLLREDPALWRV